MVLSKQYNFWFVFIVISFLAAVISYQYAHQVFSFVNVSITTNRQQILEQAKQLATDLNWDIKNYHNVISFDSQDDLQCFVELEAGGKDAFVAMFKTGTFYPYYWNVRFFKEKEIVEMNVWFSPEGEKLGFAQKIAEQTQGSALTKEQAQHLIEKSIDDWCPHFNAYQLITYNSETRDTGRVDHNFMYERTDKTIGQGLYRFSAVVCGDTITRFEPTVKIPDNFMRRYQQMRSANNLIAAVGMFFFRFIYIFLFSLLGLIFFYRRDYLLFKQSACAALCIAGGMFLSGLNNYLLWWLSYNTIQSPSTFVLMKLLEQFLVFIYLFGITFFTLVVSEAAGRFIYKKHIQFFQVFTVPAISSYEIAHQVFFGYLCVPFLFLYEVVFSYITKVCYGWWTPASSLFEPNIIASFFPWFEAISKGLYAGFFEEVLFRALPFAMMAVLSARSKHKKIWFVIIFLVQALIFGACHANYPNQPSYARLIEILPISCIFGWIYLQFGLLPGIITHFVYDAIWFAMPIFTSNLLWSKIIVIVLIGLPLWIVLFAYIIHKRFYNLPVQYFNQAFFATEPLPIVVEPRRVGKKIPTKNITCMAFLACIGLLAWIMTYKFHTDVDPLLITKPQAIEIARQAISDTFSIDLDKNWTAVAICQDDCSSMPSRFIWQKYGKTVYTLMEGSYLLGVCWKVSFVKFSGAVEDRGEAYDIIISSSHIDRHLDRQSLLYYPGHITAMNYTLPEHFVGADIDQNSAEKIAYESIEKEYGIQKGDVSLISVTSDKFDQRRDWTIIVQDMKAFDFNQGGQARIKIKVSGDKMTSYSRFIFVPEDWSRAEEEKLMIINLFKMILMFLMFGFIAIGFILAGSWLPFAQFGQQIFTHKAFFIGIVSLVYAINSSSVLITTFTTTEPFYDQLIRLILTIISSMLWQLLFYSTLLSAAAVRFVRAAKSNILLSITLACAIGFMILGVSSFMHFYQPYFEPVVGGYGSSAHLISTLAFAGEQVKKLYFLLAAMIAMFIILKKVSRLTTFWLWQALIIMLFFISFQSMQYNSSPEWMIVHGMILGIVVYLSYYLVLQYNMTILPLVCGIVVIGTIIPEIIYPAYYGASIDGLIAIGIVFLSSLFFYEQFYIE